MTGASEGGITTLPNLLLSRRSYLEKNTLKMSMLGSFPLNGKTKAAKRALKKAIKRELKKNANFSLLSLQPVFSSRSLWSRRRFENKLFWKKMSRAWIISLRQLKDIFATLPFLLALESSFNAKTASLNAWSRLQLNAATNLVMKSSLSLQSVFGFVGTFWDVKGEFVDYGASITGLLAGKGKGNYECHPQP